MFLTKNLDAIRCREASLTTAPGIASCCSFNIEDETAVLLPLKWSFYIPELPLHLPQEPACSLVRGSMVGWERRSCGVRQTNLGSIPSSPLTDSVTLGKLTLTSQSLEGFLVC